MLSMRSFAFYQVLIATLLFSFHAQSLPSQRTKKVSSVFSEESMYVLEPYLGYERGYLTQKGIPEITTMGACYGARLGARFIGIGFGLDYLIGSESATQSGQKSDFKPTELGFFLNYKVMSSFVLYGTYLLSAKAKVQSSSNPSDFSGSGYKLGVGWAVLPYLDINLELFNRTYTTYGGSSISNSLLSSTVGLSLSFPIF